MTASAMIGTCDESEKFDSDRGTGSDSWLLVLYSACTVITCIQGRGQCKVDLGTLLKKNGIFWEFFKSQNFCKFTKLFFLYAKIILRCQNMFYNSGEVISDQFHHITLDSKSGKF